MKRKPPSVKTVQEIARRFTYHKPDGDQSARYETIRAQAGAFAQELVRHCPESRELSSALTNLDQVVFWANASIAREIRDQEDETNE